MGMRFYLGKERNGKFTEVKPVDFSKEQHEAAVLAVEKAIANGKAKVIDVRSLGKKKGR